MQRAMDLIVAWCRARRIAGMRLEVVRLPGRTPLLFIEVPGAVDDTVLLYGHMDKQPEMTGWAEGLGPWQPVLRGDRLYGRGGADDGYSTFASLAALEVLQDQSIPHARCVVIIEGCEESGSGDLPALHRAPARADRHAVARRLPRLRRRRLRAALVHDVAARDGDRQSARRRAARRRALGRGEWDRAVELSDRALAARPARGRRTRARSCPSGSTSPIPEQRLAQARAMAGALGDGRRESLSVARRDAARDRRRGRADPESHLAPAARDHRRRRPARRSARPATCCAPVRRCA